MDKPLKALILAAGLGTRLRPLTLNIPKCLVEINSKPLLGHWLEKLEKLGCESVLVNTHYLESQVKSFIINRSEKKMKVKIVHEEHLLGTAGTLLSNIDFFENSTVLMLHADNYTSTDLKFFLNSYYLKPKNCLLTMLTFTTETPSKCGIVVTDKDGILIDFHEKKSDPPGNCANGAIYLFDNSLIKKIKSLNKNAYDFSKDVIPIFKGMINTWHTDKIFVDIGTPKALKDLEIYLSKEKFKQND